MIIELDKNKKGIEIENIVLKDLFLGVKSLYFNTFFNRKKTFIRSNLILDYLELKLNEDPLLQIDRNFLSLARQNADKGHYRKEDLLYNIISSIQPLVRDCILRLNVFRTEKFDKKKVFDASYLDYIEFFFDQNNFNLKFNAISPSINVEKENSHIVDINNLLLEVLISLYLNDKFDFNSMVNFGKHIFIEFFKLGILLNYDLPIPIMKRITYKNNVTKCYPFYPGFSLSMKRETYFKITEKINVLK